MDYVKIGLFKIIVKILEVIYRLNLLIKNKDLPNIVYCNVKTSI